MHHTHLHPSIWLLGIALIGGCDELMEEPPVPEREAPAFEGTTPYENVAGQSEHQKERNEGLRVDLEALEKRWKTLKDDKYFEKTDPFERVVEKMDERMEEARAALEQLYAADATAWTKLFPEMENRLEKLDEQLDAIEERFPVNRFPSASSADQ